MLRAAVILALGFGAASARAAVPFEPPMNAFHDAYYVCEGGEAFLVSYDGEHPTTASVTTSNHEATYALRRAPVSAGAEFSQNGVRFWTDGTRTAFTGARKAYEGCALKAAR